MKTNLTLLFLLCTLNTLFFSCKKEEVPQEPTPEEPIILEPVLPDVELTVEFENGLFKCNWTKINFPSFDSYKVIISPYPIGSNILLDPNAKVAEITDSLVTSRNLWVEELINSEYFFQVWVNVEDSLVYSNEVKVDIDEVFKINTNGDSRIINYSEKNALYIFSSDQMFIYDYQEEQVIQTVAGSFSFTYFDVGDNGLGEEIYLVDSNHQVLILDANTLELKETVPINGEVFSIATNEQGRIALAVNNENAPLQIWDRESLSIIKVHNFSTLDETRVIKYLSKEDNILIEKDGDKIHYIQMDENGEILIQKENSFSFYPSSNNFTIECSTTGDYFVVMGKEDIRCIDSELNSVSYSSIMFGDFYGSYDMLAHNAYNDYIYLRRSESTSGYFVNNLYDLEFPEFSSSIGYNLDKFPSFFLFFKNEELMIAFSDFGGVVIRPLEL